MKKTNIPPEIYALAAQLQKVRERAKRLGIFCNERELLSCSGCDIEEDITIEGLLIVSRRSNPVIDTGMRFMEVDAEKGLYRCPGCGKKVKPPESEWQV